LADFIAELLLNPFFDKEIRHADDHVAVALPQTLRMLEPQLEPLRTDGCLQVGQDVRPSGHKGRLRQFGPQRISVAPPLRKRLPARRGVTSESGAEHCHQEKYSPQCWPSQKESLRKPPTFRRRCAILPRANRLPATMCKKFFRFVFLRVLRAGFVTFLPMRRSAKPLNFFLRMTHRQGF